MGDRRQVVFDYGKEKIFLYSHWGGYHLPQNVASAIDFAKGRWADHSYFTRIVIDQVTKDSRDIHTNWGIYPSYMDSEYNDVEINVEAQTVTIGTTSWNYEDFIAQYS